MRKLLLLITFGFFSVFSSLVYSQTDPDTEVQAPTDYFNFRLGSDLDFEKTIADARAMLDYEDPKSIVFLARCLEHGIGTEIDFDAALELYIKAAELHDPAGLEGQGRLYVFGLTGELKIEKGLKLLESAIALGYGPACTTLGEYYLGDFYRLPREKGNALDWLGRSDSPDAQTLLGEYSSANGEFVLAKEHFEAAIESEHPVAMLGLYQINGDDKLLVRAMELLKPAADQDHAESQLYYGLALSYMNDEEEDESNEERSIEWIGRAAKNGSREAQYLYSYYYDEGKVLQWLKKAADQNHSDAQIRLGEWLYEKGKMDKAQKWFDAAAAQGHREAKAWGTLVRGEFETPDESIRPSIAGGNEKEEDK